ncbi:DNA polymerase Y family protein [Acidocella sp.]|uniref:Y-family DNA polymerase n=1 Tax=Acidocella sp. TaxID=50710 RepID=UPI0025C23209|nr:DNA polymerase Y family protein [Acidocella sp.]
MRVVSLFLPDWPIDRLRRAQGASQEAAPEADAGEISPDGPLVLVQRIGNRRLIYAANMAARAAGLRPGVAVAQAQALVPELGIQDVELGADAAALKKLGLWALRLYSPLVAVDPPDGLVIDATGAAHLRGGEEAMLHDMVVRLAASGINARAAMADSWGAAHAFARATSKPVIVVPPGETATLLQRLPLAFLRLPSEMVDQLRRLGFERVSDIASQPRGPLTQRFGPELHRRLDQALGRLREPIEPIRAPELIEARWQFAEPIGAPETLARYTGKLAGALCEMLVAKGVGARRLDLLFHRVDSEMQAIRIGTAMPNRDAKRLTRLLCDKLETIDPGFGVEAMSLCATLAEPFETKQVRTSLLEETPDTDVSSLVDILANRVGGANLYRFAPVESDVPERSVGRIAPASGAVGRKWPASLPRPVRLLRKPEPIETMALLPDHPPVSFSWRGVRRRISRADGPERIFGEWWKRDAENNAVRDYFQVEDEQGERFWIFRSGDGEHPETGGQSWYLHGIFG